MAKKSFHGRPIFPGSVQGSATVSHIGVNTLSTYKANVIGGVKDNAICTDGDNTMITGLTVGYGDVVPTTISSRVVSVLVGLIGLIFFGILVAVATRALGKTVGEKRDL
ncbi:potassium channel family protein [Methyloceanibacter caenitepidi]|uniref:potassium channel family protein n=1 Tax=Methyloceanibacter caenitepidi TaxID=1384459 RepID=UPI0005EF224E|nr:potassium channel family protein [Methyloceanibacter caenitepidi]